MSALSFVTDPCRINHQTHNLVHQMCKLDSRTLVCLSIVLMTSGCSVNLSNAQRTALRFEEEFYFQRGGKELLRFGPVNSAREIKARICLVRVRGFGENGPKKENGFVNIHLNAKGWDEKKWVQIVEAPTPGHPSCVVLEGWSMSIRLGRSAIVREMTEEVFGTVEWETEN
jgi:hypothetical protein